MWHGYNDIKREGHFEWVNPSGRCKRYTNWQHGEPNNLGNEDCTQMYGNGRWNDLKCSSKLASICEYGARSKNLCGSNKPRSNRFTVNGIQYEIFKQILSWGAAQNSCKRKGGNLATITDAHVDHELVMHMKKR